MQITARHEWTSTCPLCRDVVMHAYGIRCAECGSVSHTSCLKELGECHPQPARVSVTPTPSPEREGPSRWEIWSPGYITVSALLLGSSTLILMVTKGVIGFGVFGSGLWALAFLQETLRGLLDGKVRKVFAKEDVSLRESRTDYLYHLLAWTTIASLALALTIWLVVADLHVQVPPPL